MKRLLWILALLMLASACNQNGLGVWNATKNFFATPINAVKSFFTDASYEYKKSRTGYNSASAEDIRYCAGSDGSPIMGEKLSELEKLSDEVMATTCQCRPWGDCPTNVCPCERQCPNDFKIFERPEHQPIQNLTTIENGLAFRNGSTPGDYEETQGYCWGHANLNSQFNRLAFFNPEQKPPYDIQSSDPAEQQRAVEFYKKVIDQINNNEVAEIPGFKNLHQFSSHPALQSYIGDKVAKTWANKAMSWQGLGVALSSKEQLTHRYELMFEDIKSRIDMNLQPTIVFTSRGSPFFTHATLVSHYEILPNGSTRLCIRDNNYPDDWARKCNNPMEIVPGRGLVYNGAIKTDGTMIGGMEIGGISLAHNENADTLAQAESLKQKCLNDRDCDHK